MRLKPILRSITQARSSQDRLVPAKVRGGRGRDRALPPFRLMKNGTSRALPLSVSLRRHSVMRTLARSVVKPALLFTFAVPIISNGTVALRPAAARVHAQVVGQGLSQHRER